MPIEIDAREERRLALVAATLLAAIATAVMIARPGQAWFLPPCPLHALTGYFCPGCGSTRALYLLVHGRPLAAFRQNLLAASLLPYVIYELLAVLTRRLPVISTRLRPWAVYGLLAVIVLFGVVRNLPFAPFSLLAPTDLP